MKNNYFALLLLFLIPITTLADGRKGKYNWPAYSKVEVPDSLKQEPAFFVSNVTTLDFTDAFETQLVVFQRIYVNLQKGVDEYAERELFIGSFGTLVMINARIVKKDGSIVELNDEEIKETSVKKQNRYATETLRRVQLIYPGLETGDVIDFAYEIDLKGYLYSELFYLEDDIPSLYSRITLRNFSVLDLTAFTLNKMPVAVPKREAGIETLSWEKKGVGTIKRDFFNALSPTAPCFVYMLWKRGETLDYKTYYYYDQMDYTIRFGLGNVLTHYFTDAGVINEDEDAFVALKKMILYMEKNFKWNEKGTMEPVRTSQALADNLIDEMLFTRYVCRFLNERDIRFEHGFTKSLLNGKFEHGLVSLEQLSDRYIIFYDALGQEHFLFPSSSEDCYFYIDEIPSYLEGNQSIALYGEKESLDEQAAVLLPQSDAASNSHFSNVLLAVSGTDSLKVGSKRKDTFKGQYSFLMRSCNADDWMEDYNVKPDSVELAPTRIDPFYPYEVEFNREFESNAYFEKIEEALWWFKVEDILPKGIYLDDELAAECGDYMVLPFLKTNSTSIFIQSDEPIRLEEGTTTLSHESAIGSIKITVVQLMDNVLKLNYEVKVLKRHLENKQDVDDFKRFMQQYADFSHKKWVVRKGS